MVLSERLKIKNGQQIKTKNPHRLRKYCMKKKRQAIFTDGPGKASLASVWQIAKI